MEYRWSGPGGWLISVSSSACALGGGEVLARGVWRSLGGRGTPPGRRGRRASPQLSRRSLRRWGSGRRRRLQARAMGIPPAQATFAPSGRDLYVSCTFPSLAATQRCLLPAAVVRPRFAEFSIRLSNSQKLMQLGRSFVLDCS